MIDNEQYFLDIIEELEKKLHFPKDTFTAKKDNRIRGLFIDLYNYVDGEREKCYLITYNSKKLNDKLEIKMGVAHEMGHVRKSHFGSYHYLSLEEKEYEAEGFALDVIKKYYPEYYLRAVDLLLKYIDNDDGLYSKAFQRLYDERKNEE